MLNPLLCHGQTQAVGLRPAFPGPVPNTVCLAIREGGSVSTTSFFQKGAPFPGFKRVCGREQTGSKCCFCCASSCSVSGTVLSRAELPPHLPAQDSRLAFPDANSPHSHNGCKFHLTPEPLTGSSSWGQYLRSLWQAVYGRPG